MKVKKILDVFQGELKTVVLSLVEEPKDSPVSILDKNIKIRITDIQKNSVIFEYDDSSSDIVDKSSGCDNSFNLNLPEEAVSYVGDFFLEVNLYSSNFDRKFLFTYTVRESAEFLPTGLPPIPPPNTTYKRFSYLSPTAQTQHIIDHNMGSLAPYISINLWDDINSIPGEYVMAMAKPNPLNPLNSTVVSTEESLLIYVTLAAL